MPVPAMTRHSLSGVGDLLNLSEIEHPQGMFICRVDQLGIHPELSHVTGWGQRPGSGNIESTGTVGPIVFVILSYSDNPEYVFAKSEDAPGAVTKYKQGPWS